MLPNAADSTTSHGLVTVVDVASATAGAFEPDPTDVFAIGLNYADHATNTGSTLLAKHSQVNSSITFN